MPQLGPKARAWENFSCRELPASYQGSSLTRPKSGFHWSLDWTTLLLPQSQACSLPVSSAPSSSFPPSLWVNTSEDQRGSAEIPPKEEKEVREGVMGFQPGTCETPNNLRLRLEQIMAACSLPGLRWKPVGSREVSLTTLDCNGTASSFLLSEKYR